MSESGKHFSEDQWWVSPYNFIDEVTNQMELPHQVEIHDATLRDGEQTPGVVMTIEDKIALAKKMDEIGVERIEAGMPAVSPQDFEAIKEITKLGLKAKVYTFARAIEVDIDKAIDCGADGVILEVPIGYPKLTMQFNWTWEEVLKRSAPIIKYAKQEGLHVVFFPYDTTRARKNDLENLLKGIMDVEAPHSVGVVDTMGCALPIAIQHMVREVKRITDLPVEVHTHNDFGMAVATELAGIEAGASCVHSCANGLGERTGNAALEELMVGMQLLYGIDNGYDLALLPELGELASRITGVPIAANKPILGERNFTRESGIGVDLVLKQPLAMFGTHPALTGRTGDIVLGKKSGKASITYTLDRLGIEGATDDQIADILVQVKQKGIEKGSLLDDDEFKTITEAILR
ncbi:MAG: 2-isopropylmalate synthase [Verrucomicrobiota bacterium]